MNRSALGVFAAICGAALILFAVGVWKHSALALAVALLLFIIAPFAFGLRART